MRTKLALPLAALALASCETYPPGPGYPPPGAPQGEATYRAIGTEPFWDLEIGRDMVFTDRGNNVRVIQRTPRPINGVAGEIFRTQRIEANVIHTRCSDGMSDRTYPDTVQVRVDGREYRGCGAPIAFFGEVGETGQPNYPGSGAMTLTGTNWRVVSINGRPAPPRNFYINFIPDRIGAKFGCNSLGGGYSVNGAVLTAGPIIATRMACPDMSFENQGSAILSRPMNIAGGGDRLVLSNSAGSIELVRSEETNRF
jgi:heat shock protein HslJ